MIPTDESRRVCFSIGFLIVCAWIVGLFIASPTRGESYRVSTFQCDVTIPLDHRCMGLLPTKSVRVLDPLLARGMILMGPERPIVFVAVDWCEIRNDSYDAWRNSIAEAAGTTLDRVLLASLHQHDAPVVDARAAALLQEVGLRNELYDVEFERDARTRVAQSVREALPKARPISRLGVGKAIVKQIASSRRIVDSQGKVSFARGSSSGRDPALRAAPEGDIDPWLRMLAFGDDQGTIVELYSYATHPMSFYGRGEVSSDFVGLARRRFQEKHPERFPIYFSGCSGDVTAGKYNDGSQVARETLTDRLYDAMCAASDNVSWSEIETIRLRSVPIALPFNTDAKLGADALRADLINPQLAVIPRIYAAMSLASRERVEANRPVHLTCVEFGRAARVVLFPGESFVGYQRMAQDLRPDTTVFSIGYGECWPGYIPTAAAFDEGFSDQWLWVAPGAADGMRQALTEALQSPN